MTKPPYPQDGSFTVYGLKNYKEYAVERFGDSLNFQKTDWGREWIADLAITANAEDLQLLQEEVDKMEKEVKMLSLRLEEERLQKKEEMFRLEVLEKEVEDWREDPVGSSGSVGTRRSGNVHSSGGNSKIVRSNSIHQQPPAEKVASIRGFLFGGSSDGSPRSNTASRKKRASSTDASEDLKKIEALAHLEKTKRELRDEKGTLEKENENLMEELRKIDSSGGGQEY